MRDFVQSRALLAPVRRGAATVHWRDAQARDRVLHRPVLYVSSASAASLAGTVNVYAIGARGDLDFTGQLTGLDSPTRLAVDEANNLYVCQTDNGAPVLVFARGATQPFRRLDTQDMTATAVAVSGDGTVYVAARGSGGVVILAYRSGAAEPFEHLSGSFADGITDLIVDRSGNLYFDVPQFFSLGGTIGEFKAGSTTAIDNLGFPVTDPLAARVARNGNMVLYSIPSQPLINVFARGSTAVKFSIPVQFGQAVTFNRAGNVLYVSGAGTLTEYAYPTGTALGTVQVGGENFGVATNPAPEPPVPWSLP